MVDRVDEMDRKDTLQMRPMDETLRDQMRLMD